MDYKGIDFDGDRVQQYGKKMEKMEKNMKWKWKKI